MNVVGETWGYLLVIELWTCGIWFVWCFLCHRECHEFRLHRNIAFWKVVSYCGLEGGVFGGIEIKEDLRAVNGLLLILSCYSLNICLIGF